MKWRPFLTELATRAGAIHLKYFQKQHRIEHKFRAGIVTEADKESEAYLVRAIRRKFPKCTLITEETGHYPGDDLVWLIDPLDGTTNYAHGFPWFCVSIGVWRNGVALAGVVYNSVYRELFYAEKGEGAYFNRKRIRVSRVAKLKDALLGTGFYYSKGARLRVETEVFRGVNEVAMGVRRPGAAALDLAYVAAGRYDGFWERGLSPWDVAAGWCLIEEAGGQISDYSGKPTHYDSREILVSNGRIHPALVSNIQRTLKEF